MKRNKQRGSSVRHGEAKDQQYRYKKTRRRSCARSLKKLKLKLKRKKGRKKGRKIDREI